MYGSLGTRRVTLQCAADYDEFMSWATDVQLLAHDAGESEAGFVTIAYPLSFFDKRDDGKVPLAQLLMAIVSEPFSAFSFYRGAARRRALPPGRCSSGFPPADGHTRGDRQLDMPRDEPIIGTIVKPKTGRLPSSFPHSVVEAALAGARFTKADEDAPHPL